MEAGKPQFNKQHLSVNVLNFYFSIHYITDALLTAAAVGDASKKSQKNLVENSYTIDEALKLTGDGMYQLKIFTIFGLSIYSMVLESTNLSYALPLAKCDLKMSLVQQGVANSVSFIGVISTAYLWGFLSDTWGRRKVLLLAYIITFIFSSLSSLSTTTLMMFITRFFTGVG